MTEKNSRLPKPPQSIAIRVLIIGLLALLLLIPLSIIQKIVQERNSRYLSTIDEISATWGKPQTLQGPILLIPYVEHVLNIDTITDKNGETKTVTRNIFNNKTAVILPKTLNVDINLHDEERHRGIYKTLVYTANMSLSGEFDYKALIDSATQQQSERRHYKWKKAWVLIGLSDTKAIAENAYFEWGDHAILLQPGTQSPKFMPAGFNVPLGDVDLNQKETSHKFKIQLTFKGSQGVKFAPLGQVSKAHITSTWQHPSFQGDILPQQYEATNDGFSAKWDIPYLARNYPQRWIMEDENYAIDHFTAGVNLFEPTSLYSKTLRSVKYGIIFVILTFLALLIFELITKTRFHIIQYGVVAVALSLFYLILLSLAEQLAFLYAYIVASGVTILTISLYVFVILKDKWRTGIIFALLLALYAVLYSLLQVEDYALLFGTSLLFLITVVIMYVTRNLKFEM